MADYDCSFHCLFCHGFEESGSESAGILAVGLLTAPPMALHMARMANRMAENITIYTNGNEAVADKMKELMGSKPLTIDSRQITSLERNVGGEGMNVGFKDGGSKHEAFLVSSDRHHAQKSMD